MPLTRKALDVIKKTCRIVVPTYNRAVQPAIVHLGVGNFFRSHLACNTDIANAASGDEDPWLIHGIGILDIESEKTAHKILTQQDCLFGIRSMPNQTDFRIIGSLARFDWIPSNEHEAQQHSLNSLSAPDTKIVSLTITEKGYCQNLDGSLDASRADVSADLQRVRDLAQDPSRTTTGHFETALGLLAAGLVFRHQNGWSPVTLLSCDNLPHNGKVLQSLVNEFLDAAAPQVGDALRDAHGRGAVTFPCSMVDRITPATTQSFTAEFANRSGVVDGWPVVAEDFSQWCLEDAFAAGRPRWENAKQHNVMIVDDVAPFEEMKLKLLNGGHTSIAYLATLIGYTRVDEALADRRVGQFMRSYMDSVTPTVPDVPGIDLDVYKDQIIARFQNEHISDQLARLCQDGSKKFLGFVVPALHELIRAREAGSASVSTAFIADVVAAWIAYLHNTPMSSVDDPRAEELSHAANQAVSTSNKQRKTDFVAEFLSPIAANDDKFVSEVCSSLQILSDDGAERLLSR